MLVYVLVCLPVEPGPDSVPHASEQPMRIDSYSPEHPAPKVALQTLDESFELLDRKLRDPNILLANEQFRPRLSPPSARTQAKQAGV